MDLVLFHPHLLKCSPAINEILLSCRFSRMSKKKQQKMHRGMLVCTDCCFLCHIMTLSMFYYLYTSLLSVHKLPLFSFCFSSKTFLENDSFFGKYFLENQIIFLCLVPTLTFSAHFHGSIILIFLVIPNNYMNQNFRLQHEYYVKQLEN